MSVLLEHDSSSHLVRRIHGARVYPAQKLHVQTGHKCGMTQMLLYYIRFLDETPKHRDIK